MQVYANGQEVKTGDKVMGLHPNGSGIMVGTIHTLIDGGGAMVASVIPGGVEQVPIANTANLRKASEVWNTIQEA